MIVILDSNILSLLVTPIGEDWPEDQKLFTEVYQCTEWFYRLLARGAFLTSSDLWDYEVRREVKACKN